MLLQYTPDPFDGIIFAVVGWVISKVNGELKRIDKIGETLHKLRAPTVIFGTIIQIQQQGFNLWKPIFL